MKTPVLLIGLGQVGMGYDLNLNGGAHVYTHARAFEVHPRFDLVAAVDVDGLRRHAFEASYERPAYPDVASALAAHRPEIVAIAGPTSLHGELVRQVLAGSTPRVILCEKPLAYAPTEATAMVAACEARGVALYVNYMRRSDPGVIETHRRLVSGEIATPIKGVAWYSKGFLHNGSHFFNLLQYWLGPVEHSEILDAGRLWDGHDPEPDVRVVFAQGTMVFLAAREEAFSHYTVELLAANGRLRYEQGGERIEWQAAQPDANFAGYTVLAAQPEVIPSEMDRYQWHVVEQLAHALDGRDAQLCTGRDALATLESMHQLMERR